ncbi:MAG: lipopolysaccharide heptosyltransferase II [Candidatus Bathyarchaeota archaeon]
MVSHKFISFAVLYHFGVVKIISSVGHFFIPLIKSKPKPRKFIERILVFRIGGIGDVLMTTPFLRALRTRFPKAHITYLVGNWAKEGISGNPNIDTLVTFDEKIFFNAKKMPNIFRLIKEIKNKNFDLAFVLDISFVFSLVTYLANIPLRVGFNRNGEGFALTYTVQYSHELHLVTSFLDTLSFFGIDSSVASKDMEIAIYKEDEEYARNLFSIFDHSTRDFIVGIAPGGAKNPGEDLPLARWPLEHYAELIKELIKQFKTIIILFGDKNDRNLTEKLHIASSSNIVDIAGQTTIKQAAAVIRKCDLFITHDAGLMHIAAASGASTLSIFGPTDALEKAPIGRKHFFIKKPLTCSPCYIDGIFPNCELKKCLTSIKPRDVLCIVTKILQKSEK